MTVAGRQSSVAGRQSSVVSRRQATVVGHRSPELTRSQQLGLIIVTVLFVGYVAMRLFA